MCANCMMGAMTAAAGATGLRAWLATKRDTWMTPGRLRRATALLVVTAGIASSVRIG